MNGLDAMLAQLLNDAQRVAFAATAFAKTAADIGLETSGAGLIALGHRARFFAADALHREGHVPPTLWLFDDDARQWAFEADFMSTEDEAEATTNWGTTRLLLKKLDTVAYVIVQQTVSIKVDRGTTLTERKKLREDPALCEEVVVIFGEAIDGAGLLMSYRISEAGQIDIDTPISMLVGHKDRWPGPDGAAYIDHGFPILLERRPEPPRRES